MDYRSVLEAEKQARTIQNDNRWLLSTNLLQTVEKLEDYVPFAKYDKSAIDNIQLEQPDFSIQLHQNLSDTDYMRGIRCLPSTYGWRDEGFSHFYATRILDLEIGLLQTIMADYATAFGNKKQ